MTAMTDDDGAEALEHPPAAWISTVPDHEWTAGALAELHPRVVDPAHGRVDHIMAVHSLNPTGMAAHQAVYASAMRGTGSLRKVERELIALVVSLENHCHY
jgi:alkylhydroperoxidase family enzyme